MEWIGIVAPATLRSVRLGRRHCPKLQSPSAPLEYDRLRVFSRRAARPSDLCCLRLINHQLRLQHKVAHSLLRLLVHQRNRHRKSAFTGNVVVSTISRMCASISSRETPPSRLPREKANPAEVVASASKPRFSKQIVVPMSHGFGSTKHPDSCIFLNFAVTEVSFAELMSKTYAALAHARVLELFRFGVSEFQMHRNGPSAP